MLPALRRVEIFLFDLHSALRPFLNASLLQPAFGFLLDRKAYEATLQGQVAAPPAAHFTVSPIVRQLKRNHFWKHFRQILPAGSTGDGILWSLQTPLRCVPRGMKLEMQTNLAGVTARVRPVVLLWPAGWSSNLEITIQGDHTAQQLQDLVREILTGSPFLLDATSRKLSEVFARLSRDLKEDLYPKGAVIGDVIKVPRYIVVAITASADALPRYSDRFHPGTSGTLMTDADRVLIHGALLGRPVKHEEVLLAKKGEDFLETRFLGEDFAVTYFQHGSLLSLSHASTSQTKSPASLHCLTSNVRSCFLIAHALINLYDDAKAYEKSNPLLAELRAAAAASLRDLPTYYRNPLCRGFFLNHGRLKKFQEAA